MTSLHAWDPHHDGSPLYVDQSEPALGDTVTVRVRVPHRPDGSPGGGSAGRGVFDLTFDWADGSWRLTRCAD